MVAKKRQSTGTLLAEIEALTSVIKHLRDEMKPLTERVTIDNVEGGDFYELVASFEAQVIESALQITGGRQNRAARLLNLRPSTLSWKIKKLEEEGKFPQESR